MAQDRAAAGRIPAGPGTGAAAPTLSTQVSVAHTVPGRLRLKLNPPQSGHRLAAAGAALAGVPGVQGVRTSTSAWSLVVEYDPARVGSAALLAVPVPDGAAPTASYPDQVEASAFVAAPPHAVWQTLADPQRMALHIPGTMRVTGTVNAEHWTAEIEVLGKVVTEQVHVAERQRERRLVLTLDGALRARMTVTLTPDSGGTRLHERLEYALPGRFLGRLVNAVAARPRLRAQLAQHLARIADAVAYRREAERG